MAQLIRATEWSRTPLGEIRNWPPPLLTTVNLMLSSPFPSALFWGTELTLLYNDAYMPFTSTKHPGSLGRPGSEVWREAWHILGPQYDRALHYGESSLQQNVLIPIEVEGRVRDFYWNNSISPVYDEGRVVGVFNVCQDRTDAILAAERLRESEARASRILQSIGDAVIVTDAETRVVRMNPVAEALTGWSHSAAQGRPLAEVFRILREETREVVESPADKVRRLGRVVGLANHTILVQHNGGEVHIDDSGAPIRNDKGELTGIVLVFRDIGERRATEKALQQTAVALKASEEELRWTVKLNAQIPWTADTEGHILDFSPRWLELTGLSREQALGDGWADVPHPHDLPRMGKAWRHALETGVPYDVEHRIRTANGDYRWMRSRAYARRSENGVIVKWYGTTEDIHDRKQAENALIQTEKLAAVGRLASSIAHEINNPLESVTNLLYLARITDRLSDVHSYLDTAERELRRVSVISSQTLRFHRQSTGPTLVTAASLTDTILTIYQGRLVNSHVHLEHRQRSKATVLCLEGEIRQVLNNLVGNAIDAMHSGGRLLLRSRDATHWPSSRRGIIITVADTGSGISEPVARHIFEPFFTTKGISGTGLGLWIAQEIVARHHGSIRVRSSQRPGRSGTVFTLFLPFEAVVQ